MVLAAFVALKGGVGKTTSTMFTAAGLAQTGRTCVWDLSPQRSATKWAQAAQGGHLGFDVIDDPGEEVAALATRYRHILIDTPPEIVPIIGQVLQSVEIVVAPIRPTWLDLDQAPELAALVESAVDPDGLPVLWWLLTQSDPRTSNGAETRAALVAGGQNVISAEVGLWPATYGSAGGRPIGRLWQYRAVVGELLTIDRSLDDGPEGR